MRREIPCQEHWLVATIAHAASDGFQLTWKTDKLGYIAGGNALCTQPFYNFHHSLKCLLEVILEVFHVLHSNTEPNGAGVGRSIGHDTMLIHWSLVTQLQLGDLDHGRSGDRAYNKAEMLYEMVHRFPYGCVSSTVRNGMGTWLLSAVQF